MLQSNASVRGSYTNIDMGSGFPIVGGLEEGTSPFKKFFFETPPSPPKPMPPPPLKNEAAPLKHETPFHEMISRKKLKI